MPDTKTTQVIDPTPDTPLASVDNTATTAAAAIVNTDVVLTRDEYDKVMSAVDAADKALQDARTRGLDVFAPIIEQQIDDIQAILNGK